VVVCSEYCTKILISGFGGINWPPSSPDLTAPDFFLWGYLKAQVYATKPRNIQELKERVIATVREINVPLLGRVMGGFAVDCTNVFTARVAI
jgi:hypothetical protein